MRLVRKHMSCHLYAPLFLCKYWTWVLLCYGSSNHIDVTTSTSTFTKRGFRDELMCLQGNYHPSSLPWRTGLSRSRVNTGCGDLSKQGCNLILTDDTTQRESLVLVTPSVGLQILSYVTRLDYSQLCVIFASKLDFTVFEYPLKHKEIRWRT